MFNTEYRLHMDDLWGQECVCMNGAKIYLSETGAYAIQYNTNENYSLSSETHVRHKSRLHESEY